MAAIINGTDRASNGHFGSRFDMDSNDELLSQQGLTNSDLENPKCEIVDFNTLVAATVSCCVACRNYRYSELIETSFSTILLMGNHEQSLSLSRKTGSCFHHLQHTDPVRRTLLNRLESSIL